MSYASFDINTTIQYLVASEENSVPFHTDQDQEASKMIREKKYVVVCGWGLGSGKLGWMPGGTKPVASETNDLHGLKIQQVPWHQLQEVLQNVREINSKEAIAEWDVYDDILEAM